MLGVTVTLEPLELSTFSQRLDETYRTPESGLQAYYSIWGADYPHPDCVWPDSRRHLEKNLGHLPERVQKKITYDNVVKLYNLR